MRKVLCLVFVSMFFAAVVSAQPALIETKIQKSAWGFGLIVGEPWAGWTAKYWINRDNAIDMAIGIDNGLHLHGDYLWHSTVFKISAGEMPLYYGGGIMLEMGGGQPGFGPRGVVGFDWLMPGAPLDIFLETAPTINFLNHDSNKFFQNLFLTWALGIRIYF